MELEEEDDDEDDEEDEEDEDDEDEPLDDLLEPPDPLLITEVITRPLSGTDTSVSVPVVSSVVVSSAFSESMSS